MHFAGRGGVDGGDAPSERTSDGWRRRVVQMVGAEDHMGRDGDQQGMSVDAPVVSIVGGVHGRQLESR